MASAVGSAASVSSSATSIARSRQAVSNAQCNLCHTCRSFPLHPPRAVAEIRKRLVTVSAAQQVRLVKTSLDTSSAATFSLSSTHLLTRPQRRTPSCSRVTQRRRASALVVCASVDAATVARDEVSDDYRSRPPQDVRVLVVGATGYIGKYVVRELVSRGFSVITVAREQSGIGGKAGKDQTKAELAGTEVRFGSVTDPASLAASLGDSKVDVVVSCLASRRGGKRDSWLIDYEATKNSMEVGRARGASHFVLLSAICVQKPLLEFQHAKLKFEQELMQRKDMTFSIVRPTAFFKSLGGQVESVKGGGPYVMFGDGQLCACKPISESDLAKFLADCVMEEDKVNKILPIGGPGEALTPLQQGEMLFRLLGQKPRFIRVPLGIMDFVISLLDSLTRFFPSLEDAAEFGRIGRYYASESMLIYDPKTGRYSSEDTPSYGTDTLEEFFRKVIKDGMAGQELGDQAFFS
ncbi:hypothetical protein CBR_g77624 [Chara braunii]|uniref:Divinyl chlorophyllide a 8-vinyl-reductase, chloroplastic n=1 Tax=Chara braunii TaxID=69332 RepID=A0A388JKG8_CHABU|nr:hypothetical protein CBR_g77624 [Chara braunii]|eukprot:GBG44104.1 hypothetical protein CBR_g77624 [Chara braunii]